MSSNSRLFLASTGVVALLVPSLRAQIFSNASPQIPATASFTEAIDLADIDGDGDWDAALADGGDLGNDQNRVWLNQGGAQGGALGFFVDVTATQAPVVSDQSRDIEFADLDGDGDMDLHASNDSTLVNQASRFWINAGGAQGGSAGVYVDDTAARWLGLGAAGSSVPPPVVLAAGGFIDWTSDSDFADLDLDGDVDLLHSSRGSGFNGLVPTRMFVNDGSGRFSEFNPSGHMPGSFNLMNGEPGLWCAGIQQANTLDASGAFCDITTIAIGVELADTDADFDVDALLGERQLLPRMFRNRRADIGFLGRFIDKTGADMPVAQISGTLHMEQELADMDGDGDVDLLGVGYQNFNDVAYSNGGNGVWGGPVVLPGSGNDDNDVELCDYDMDGALDVYVAGFAAPDRVYRGTDGAIAFTLLTSGQSGIAGSLRSLLARAGDVDADGDYDVLVAQDANMHELMWKNESATADAHAPYLPNVRPIANQTAAATQVLALAHVYDNTSLRQLEANDTRVELSVDGCALPEFAASVLATQVARAALPGNLVGAVSWRFLSTDGSGNTGVSAQQAYSASAANPFAFGYGAGSPGSLGTPTVHALSVPFAGTTLYVAGKGAPAGTLSWLAVTSAPAPSAPLALPGLCNVNVLGTLIALDVGPTDASGCSVAALAVPAGTPAGISVYAQFLALDGQGGDLLSSSAGLQIDTQ
ncbi:MAG: VCBS repeat-containing protein [Planctomycetota bacterium]|nr:MAG: VCBS repeat-containing protein [Planctomycetota bacterium]